MASQPPLRVIHEPGTLRPGSVAHWSARTTHDIVRSLRPEGADPLIVRADGAIMNGNTRIYVLKERGFDVDGLPRKHYER